MRVSPALFASVLLLAACSRQDEKPAASTASPAAPPAAGPHAEFIPTQAQLDRFRAEGPDPTLRKIAVADYWLNYKLMQATGIEKELGGEAQAIEALKALGDAYERKMRVAEDEVPKMIPTAFTGEGMSSGFMGMGMGSFLGMITRRNDQRGEHHVRQGSGGAERSGGAQVRRRRRGRRIAVREGRLAEPVDGVRRQRDGINGKVKMKSKMMPAPTRTARSRSTSKWIRR